MTDLLLENYLMKRRITTRKAGEKTMTERKVIPVASLVVLSFVLFLAGFIVGLFAIAAVPVSATVANAGFIGFAIGIMTGVTFISLVVFGSSHRITRRSFLYLLCIGNVIVATSVLLIENQASWITKGITYVSPVLVTMALFTAIIAAIYAIQNRIIS